MDEYAEENRVVVHIRESFPEEAKQTDEWLSERGWDEPNNAPHVWVEAFADRTTEAARAHNWALVKAHTEFIAAEYRNGSESVRSLIDVSYAENLMWDLERTEKIVTWPHIAKEVRVLYEQMWGAPKTEESM